MLIEWKQRDKSSIYSEVSATLPLSNRMNDRKSRHVTRGPVLVRSFSTRRRLVRGDVHGWFHYSFVHPLKWNNSPHIFPVSWNEWSRNDFTDYDEEDSKLQYICPRIFGSIGFECRRVFRKPSVGDESRTTSLEAWAVQFISFLFSLGDLLFGGHFRHAMLSI